MGQTKRGRKPKKPTVEIEKNEVDARRHQSDLIVALSSDLCERLGRYRLLSDDSDAKFLLEQAVARYRGLP